MAKQSPCPCRIGCGCGTMARSHRRSPAIACSSSNSSEILTKPIINSPDETYKKNKSNENGASTYAPSCTEDRSKKKNGVRSHINTNEIR